MFRKRALDESQVRLSAPDALFPLVSGSHRRLRMKAPAHASSVRSARYEAGLCSPTANDVPFEFPLTFVSRVRILPGEMLTYSWVCVFVRFASVPACVIDSRPGKVSLLYSLPLTSVFPVQPTGGKFVGQELKPGYMSREYRRQSSRTHVHVIPRGLN